MKGIELVGCSKARIKVNPRTPYKLFAYDYGYANHYYNKVRRAAQGMPSWRD